jgi:hypothetical protein
MTEASGRALWLMAGFQRTSRGHLSYPQLLVSIASAFIILAIGMALGVAASWLVPQPAQPS